MPERIQRVAEGLLQALRVVGTGQTPFILPDELQPTFDATDYYLGRLESEQVSAAGFAAVGSTQDLTVPAGQYWAVRAIGTNAVASAANGRIRVSIGLTPVSGQPVVPVFNFGATFVAAAANDQANVGGPISVVLPPGGIIRTTMGEAATTGTLTLRTRCLFHRIRRA